MAMKSIPVQGDVGFPLVVNIHIYCFTMIDSDRWPWKFSIHCQYGFLVAESSIMSFFDLQYFLKLATYITVSHELINI